MSTIIKCIGYKQNHGAGPDLLPPHNHVHVGPTNGAASTVVLRSVFLPRTQYPRHPARPFSSKTQDPVAPGRPRPMLGGGVRGRQYARRRVVRARSRVSFTTVCDLERLSQSTEPHIRMHSGHVGSPSHGPHRKFSHSFGRLLSMDSDLHRPSAPRPT